MDPRRKPFYIYNNLHHPPEITDSLLLAELPAYICPYELLNSLTSRQTYRSHLSNKHPTSHPPTLFTRLTPSAAVIFSANPTATLTTNNNTGETFLLSQDILTQSPINPSRKSLFMPHCPPQTSNTLIVAIHLQQTPQSTVISKEIRSGSQRAFSLLAFTLSACYHYGVHTILRATFALLGLPSGFSKKSNTLGQELVGNPISAAAFLFPSTGISTFLCRAAPSYRPGPRPRRAGTRFLECYKCKQGTG